MSARHPSQGTASAVCMFAVLIAAMLAQGGFYGAATNACGIVAAIMALVFAVVEGRRREDGPAVNAGIIVAPLMFFVLALAYLASALANTATLTTLSETGAWFATAAVALLACLQTPAAREKTCALLCWAGAIGAVAAFLMFATYLPWPYAMADGRLQFFMQYANAAAVWFGATALLALLSDRRDLEALFVLPFSAMLLTQSGGAVLTFGAIVAVLFAIWWRRRDYGRIVRLLLQILVAAIVFVLVQRIDTGLVCLLGIADLVLMAWLFSRIDAWLPEKLQGFRAALVLTVVLGLGVAAMVALYASRAVEALGHLGIRWVYVADAMRIAAQSPLLGIGPDNWQYAYSFYQSAQYTTLVVHNSYGQALVDVGYIGLAVLLATIVVGAWGLARSGRKRELAALVLICAHSFFDFDLQFGSIAFLVAFFACAPDGLRIGATKAQVEEGRDNTAPDFARVQLVLRAAVALACAAACAVGLFAATVKDEISFAGSMGDYSLVARLYQGNPLAVNDVNARANFLEASNDAGLYDQVLASNSFHGVQSGRQALSVADALMALDRPEEAIEFLVDELERQPYNAGLFSRTYAMAYGMDMPEELRARYQAAIDHANELAQAARDAGIENQIIQTMPPSGEELAAAEELAQ